MLCPDDVDALVGRAQHGDRDAFGRIFEELYPDVMSFVSSRAPSPALVDEIVQGAFVAVWEHLADYRSGGTFVAWVKGHARNLLLRELSSRLRRTSGGAVELALTRHAIDHLSDEERAVECTAELTARLLRCLDALAPRAREMARRRFVEDVPLAVLAQQFKQPQGALTKALSRIRQGLRACATKGAA